MNLSVKVAKFFMKLFEKFPDSSRGDLGEIFYKNEFINGTEEFRKKVMLEMAELRFEVEKKVPFSSYFGKDIALYFRNKNILDFGCSNGAVSRSIISKYFPLNLTGIDVSQNRVESARLYFDHVGFKGNFIVYDGNCLPFKSNELDTIFSFDVFEHLANISLTMKECLRILKHGGCILVVFPSFYHWTEHHLSLVSATPFIHYFFCKNTLNMAYQEIISERGEEAYWYRRKKEKFETWERSNTINGLTKRKFRKLCKEIGFLIEYDYSLAIFETGRYRKQYPLLSTLVPLFKFLGKFYFLEEFFNHRIVMILKKDNSSFNHQ